MPLPRPSLRSYRRITLITVIVLAAIIVTGAAVRLTGSGLGCPDWPTCDGGQLVAPLDEPHAIVEFVNRVVTGLVSLAVIAAVLGSLLLRPRRRDLIWWSLALVGGLALEIPLGGLTVLWGLTPPVVMAHFLLAVVLVWLAVVLHHKAGLVTEPVPATGDERRLVAPSPGPGIPVVPNAVLRWSRVTLAATVVVLCTGTVVTGAGPHGGDPDADRLPVAIETAARIHGISAVVLLVLATTLLWLAYRGGAPDPVRERGRRLVGAIVLQAAIGYTQYFTGVPPLLVGLHVLGSVLVFLAVLDVHLNLRVPAPPGPAPADEPDRPTRAPASAPVATG